MMIMIMMIMMAMIGDHSNDQDDIGDVYNYCGDDDYNVVDDVGDDSVQCDGYSPC